MPDGDQGHWLSYQELAEALRCTPNAARMHAVRRGWPRSSPNRIGDCARVLVPEAVVVQGRAMHDAEQFDAHVQRRATHDGTPANGHVQANERPVFDAQGLLVMVQETVEALVAPMREQLQTANQRAVDAERGLEELSAALVEARAVERGASERAGAMASEIGELRRLLDVADRRIEGERNRAKQETERFVHERERADAERDRAHEAERHLAAILSAKDELRRQVDMLSELLTQRRREGRSFWRRVFGR